MLLLSMCRRCFVNQQQFAGLSMVNKYGGFKRFLSGLEATNPQLQRQNIDFRKSRIRTKIGSTEKKVKLIFFKFFHCEKWLKFQNIKILQKKNNFF